MHLSETKQLTNIQYGHEILQHLRLSVAFAELKISLSLLWMIDVMRGGCCVEGMAGKICSPRIVMGIKVSVIL